MSRVVELDDGDDREGLIADHEIGDLLLGGQAFAEVFVGVAARDGDHLAEGDLGQDNMVRKCCDQPAVKILFRNAQERGVELKPRAAQALQGQFEDDHEEHETDYDEDRDEGES